MLKLNSTSLFIVQNTDTFINNIGEKAVTNFQTILSSATNCDKKGSGRLATNFILLAEQISTEQI